MAPAIAYFLLTRALIRTGALAPKVAEAIGADYKAWVSMAFYVCGVALAFAYPYAAMGLYTAVAVIWFIPDRRIERRMAAEEELE